MSTQRDPDEAVRSVRERRRAAILAAAERIFGAQGFQKTTMHDVAIAARVSRPLVYRYFPDKAGLLDAVVERVLREWNEVLVAEAARTTPGTAHTLRLVLVACLGFARDRAALRGLLARDSREALAHHSDVLERGSDLLRVLVRRILAAGVRRGDVRSDLDLDDLSHVVSEVILAYADRIVRGEEGVRGRRVEAILETLLHGLIAKPATLR